MLRNFCKLVSEAVNQGSERGIKLFIESLEIDQEKEEIYENYGVSGVLTHFFESEGISIDTDDDDDDISEEDIDSLLDDLDA